MAISNSIPGGRYLVGGVFVDANGVPLAAPEPPAPPVFDVATATRGELEAEAVRRQIEVTRADGKEGPPLVEDLRAALA